MYGIVLVGHGEVSKGFISAAEMIVGEQEKLHFAVLEPHATFEDYLKEVEEMIKDFEETLILADISGGTPSNVAMRLVMERNCSLISGVNLPVLLEILLERLAGKPLNETLDNALMIFPETITRTTKEDFIRKGLLTDG